MGYLNPIIQFGVEGADTGDVALSGTLSHQVCMVLCFAVPRFADRAHAQQNALLSCSAPCCTVIQQKPLHLLFNLHLQLIAELVKENDFLVGFL